MKADVQGVVSSDLMVRVVDRFLLNGRRARFARSNVNDKEWLLLRPFLFRRLFRLGISSRSSSILGGPLFSEIVVYFKDGKMLGREHYILCCGYR